MPHVGHDIVKKLVKSFTHAASTILLVVLFFILQYIFDMKFQCSCIGGGLHCNGVLYMVAPPLILTWVIIYIESYKQRGFCGIFKIKCCNNFCSCLLRILVKYVSVTAVWITAVFFDGDWFICYSTNLNATLTGLPCRDPTRITYQEKLEMTHIRIKSLLIGLKIICVFLSLWSIAGAVQMCRMRQKWWKKDWCCPSCCNNLCNPCNDCCENHCQKLFNCCNNACCPPYYKVVYEDLLKKQVNEHLTKELTNIAEERAKAICEPYIKVIQDHEKNIAEDPTIHPDVGESWHEISAADFYMTDKTKQEPRDWASMFN